MIDILAIVCLLISFVCLFNILKAVLTKKIGGYWWPIFPSDIADYKKDAFYFWFMFVRWMISFIGFFICGVALLVLF